MASATCADLASWLALNSNRLPIDDQLGAIRRALLPPGSTVLLQAPPAAGKTTRVPLTLMESLGADAHIVMLEPRRLAARTHYQPALDWHS